MHELSIMEEAVRMAVDAAKSAGKSRVLALRLRVGALSGVVPEAIPLQRARVWKSNPCRPRAGARRAVRSSNARIFLLNVPVATT
jgi:hypothetical protein